MESKNNLYYTKEQYDKDKQSLEKATNGQDLIDLSAFKRVMIYDICTNTNILSDNKIGCYSIEQIDFALKNPSSYSSILVETSKYLMTVSPFYMRINSYFSKMGLFNYSIDTYDVKSPMSDLSVQKYREDYYKLCSQLEKMNLKHEFSKIMNVLPSEDLFCGLIFEDSTDFFIARVPSSLCKIDHIQDGVYNFKMSFAELRAETIGGYPKIIQEAYLQYRNQQGYYDGWYIPPAEIQICIKWNESCLYPFPFLIMLAKDIFDIDIYKKLKLQKARVDNYKAILIEIPIDEDSVDKPLLTGDTLSTFAEMNKANMPDDVGLIHAPGKAEAISFKDNSNTTNNLSDAIGNLYDSSGVPASIFNGTTVSSAMKLSIENDAAMLYRVYRQFERYMNRFIKLRKFNRMNYKFAFRIQDSTVFNRDIVTDAYLKAAEHGLPFKVDYAVSLGITPNRMLGNLFNENIALGIHNQLIPLPTSYTLSSENIGRPTNESNGEELSESGQQTLDNGSNQNR